MEEVDTRWRRRRMARHGDRGVWKNASGLLLERRWRRARLLRRLRGDMD